MDDCVELARSAGHGAWVTSSASRSFSTSERPRDQTARTWSNVRRGGFELALSEIGSNPERVPDFGPNATHPTAGATIIGARPFFVAYNVYLGGAENLPVAKEVAKAVRGSSGGLRYVKGLGLEVDGQAQVSMNLVDTDQTPLHRAYDMVRMEAEARGVSPTRSELVGLVPEKVLFETAARHIGLPDFSTDMVLEHQVRAASQRRGVDGRLRRESSPAAHPVPGGGSVSALAGQLAAALAQMVAGLTVGRKKYVEVEGEMQEVAHCRASAQRPPRCAGPGGRRRLRAGERGLQDAQGRRAAAAARDEAIQAALTKAAEVPLETARACSDVARLAATCAAKGNVNTVSDAGVAALLAEAACRGAAYNVWINVASMTDRAAGAALTAEVDALVEATRASATIATTHVEESIR